MSSPLLVIFFWGGIDGPWNVERISEVTGATLPIVPRVRVFEGGQVDVGEGAWRLRGVTSNERYVERAERTLLVERQPTLGRDAASCAALIPISKSAAWWELPQDERRKVLEERSRHIAVGLEYLPTVARRLHHGRDLGEEFDFVTWFEYPPEASTAFEDLVKRLRSTEEWLYVEREVDIRLRR